MIARITKKLYSVERKDARRVLGMKIDVVRSTKEEMMAMICPLPVEDALKVAHYFEDF